MKIKKKLLMKIISALCATAALSTTPGLVSANPKKTSQNNINETTQDNQADNINANNIINNDNIRQIIVDKNSKDEDDKSRNQAREYMNSDFMYRLNLNKGDIDNIFPSLALKNIECSAANAMIKKVFQNKFDRFLYYHISGLSYSKSRIGEPLYNKFTGLVHQPNNGGFNFPSTKIALANKLIDQEKDLTKQLLLKIVCQKILDINDTIEFSIDKSIHNPYECKAEMEKQYLKWLKEYCNDDANFHNINLSWLKQYCDSDDMKHYIEDCETNKEAFIKALDDVSNNTKTDLKEKSQNYQDTYNQTYAFALAEIDVKKHLDRRQNLDENLQKLYNEQYNEVAKQKGQHDGKNVNSLYKYKDQEAQSFYNQGYFLGILKRARNDVFYDKFNVNKYEAEVKNIYIQAYKQAAYELGWFNFQKSKSPKIEPKFLENLQSDDNETIDMAELKEELKSQYIAGGLKGCRERGRKYATSRKYKSPYVLFYENNLKESELGQYYFDFKKAYDEGFQEVFPGKQAK